MRLALAQINPVVGDLEGNRRLILDRIDEGKTHAADLVVFPELAVTGYPPEDLLLRPGFIRAAEESVELIAREARGTTVLVGAPHFDRDLYNACYVCAGGEVRAVYRKRFLPNYGVFDEDRYFASGRDLILLEHGKTLVGLTVWQRTRKRVSRLTATLVEAWDVQSDQALRPVRPHEGAVPRVGAPDRSDGHGFTLAIKGDQLPCGGHPSVCHSDCSIRPAGTGGTA